MFKLFKMFKSSKGAQLLNKEHEGAIAFEYVIIMVMMIVVIYGAWTALGAQISSKAAQIATFIKGNGQTGLGT